MKKTRWNSVKVLLSASAAAVLAGAVMPSAAVAQECPGEESRRSATLSPRIGQEIQKLYELMQNDQPREAIAGFSNLLTQRGAQMSAYEKATIYELRGSQNAAIENFAGALRDFQAALNTNGLPPNRNNQLRYFIAQLQFQEGNYSQAIQGLRNWISVAQRCNVPVEGSAYYLLAAAYTQIEPPNWRAAVDPAEKAIAGIDGANPNKSYFDLMNLIYSELNMTSKRGALLERMINYWPGEKSYWTQLSGLYSNTGRDEDAFAVIEVAYRAGLLSTEAELKTVVQYYSFFDNPYRGAEVLDREMKAGNIKRNQDNLVLLSQLWSQAREHKRSIPILREAASNSSKGELSYRLGMVLLADEQYAQAERALVQALNKGGMDGDDTGDAWLLLGTARFSQAGPESVEIWARAKEAFENAQRYQKSATRASQWITYISAVQSTYKAQKDLEARQQIERCETELDRIDQQQRIRDLQNRAPTDEEVAREARIEAECSALLNPGGGGDAEPEAEAPAAAEEASEE